MVWRRSALLPIALALGNLLQLGIGLVVRPRVVHQLNLSKLRLQIANMHTELRLLCKREHLLQRIAAILTEKKSAGHSGSY